ncbi:alpha/beta hydrolase [uncultured Pelagimonas sp.]|uniref:alpha/beta fold hydrolase n=1 Tax=uncultured Pelagimonas sp. TaxID=1618102 RepID=UPI00262DE5E3|nr:alpha/beta hydrolase [uncultured Pelagimonas sp.]
MARFTTSDGVSLYYTDEGQGVPLLCLSGLSRNGRDFDYVAPLLDGVRLIRLDYRGRGQSDWAPHESYSIPIEGRDALELLDHLGIEKAAILGSSRGGLIAMGLAATVKERLLGVALNDIGPEIADRGLEVIKNYLGRRPAWKTMAEAVAARPKVMAGFANVPAERWQREAETHYREVEGGLDITYDPKLRDAVLAEGAQVVPDLWPFFEALAELPLCLVRGANSDLLSEACFVEMTRRRPDAVAVQVADRGHIPFLDESDAVAALHKWIAMM